VENVGKNQEHALDIELEKQRPGNHRSAANGVRALCLSFSKNTHSTLDGSNAFYATARRHCFFSAGIRDAV
jgi:hypothetical protein